MFFNTVLSTAVQTCTFYLVHVVCNSPSAKMLYVHTVTVKMVLIPRSDNQKFSVTISDCVRAKLVLFNKNVSHHSQGSHQTLTARLYLIFLNQNLFCQ